MQTFLVCKTRILVLVILLCLLYSALMVKFDFSMWMAEKDKNAFLKFVHLKESKRDHITSKTTKNHVITKQYSGLKDPNEQKDSVGLNRRTDAVILLSQMRSGSSVLGELFNQRVNVSFFYEPLYPFGDETCPQMDKERVAVLEKISKCQFDLQGHYKKAYLASQLTDSFATCMKTKICFTKHPKCSRFLSRDTNICKINKQGQQICPEPINTETLSSYCNTSLLRAMKVIYLCELESLLPLLKDPTVNVKVLHLVRDPRATVNSRVNELKSYKSGVNNVQTVRKMATSICKRLSNSVNFADVIVDDVALRQKYMRIRHEDFALEAMEATQAIYNFVGINMTNKMRKWIMEATSPQNSQGLSAKDTQSTSRNPNYVVSAWRQNLSFWEIKIIQQVCKGALSRLNYWTFKNEKELRDLKTYNSFAPKGFPYKPL
uniref:Sulfotransferase n=1 Tax=Phallusia mammillata TaxID=59560 RepID=A0A6F9D8M0_9ASCI|nr:carbohydrate sulfotransferase 3-like [Phallusia mammillata]